MSYYQFDCDTIHYNGITWFFDKGYEKENGEWVIYYHSHHFPGEFICLTFTNNSSKKYNLPEHLFELEE